MQAVSGKELESESDLASLIEFSVAAVVDNLANVWFMNVSFMTVPFIKESLSCTTNPQLQLERNQAQQQRLRW
jgi:hypothetical protein